MNSEQETLLFQLNRVNRILRRQNHKKRFRHSTRQILVLISRNPLINSKELTSEMDIRLSSLNELITKLIEENLIIRVKNPNDLRSFLYELTDLGKEKMKELEGYHQRLIQTIDGILDDQQEQSLIELLKVLANGIEKNLCQ